MTINWQKYAAVIGVLLGVGTIFTWIAPSIPWITRSEAASIQQDLNQKVDKITSAVSALQSDQHADHVNALLTQRSILYLQLMMEKKAHDDVAIAETQAQIDWITSQLAHPNRPAPPPPPR